MEVRKQLGWAEAPVALSHFRDRSGVEVDLILEHADGRIVAVEVKGTRSPGEGDLRGLRFLRDRLGARFHHGFLLTAAPEALRVGDRIAALPVDALWRA